MIQTETTYEEFTSLINEIRGKNKSQAADFFNTVEKLFSQLISIYIPSSDGWHISRLILHAHYISNISNLHAAYEAVVSTYYHSGLILIRSSFESLLQMLYLQSTPDDLSSIFCRYLQKKDPLTEEEENRIKEITKSRYPNYPPRYFRNFLYKDQMKESDDQQKLSQIRIYYFELSERVHHNYISSFSWFRPTGETIQITYEIINLLFWFIIIYYEQIDPHEQKKYRNALSKELIILGQQIPGIYDFQPIIGSLRNFREIFNEIIGQKNG
jgi:hypothetical protein